MTALDIEHIYDRIKNLDFDNIGIDEVYDENQEFGFHLALLAKQISNNVVYKFVNSKMPKTLSHPGNSIVNGCTYTPFKKDYLSPKPPTPDNFIYDMNLGFRPKDDKPEFEYLTNFSIKHNNVITGKLMEVKTINGYDDKAFMNNAVLGQYKMFHNSVKTRGMTPSMMYVACFLLYRCDECLSIMKSMSLKHDHERYEFNKCYCFTKSAEFMALEQLIDANKGIPFYWGKRNTVEKNELYDVINAQTPVILISLFDLIIRHRLGCVDEISALHIVNLWIAESSKSFHGAILGKFKKAKEIGVYIRSKLSMHTPVYSKNFDINATNYINNVNHAITYNDTLQTDFCKLYLKDVDITKFSPTLLLSIHDMCQYFSPSIHVNGAIELILKKTAQATQPGILTSKVVTYVDLGTSYGLVPYEFQYDDDDLNQISEIMYQSLLENPPNMQSLEAKFLESATTNSAGLSNDEVRARKQRITEQYGATEDPAELTLVSEAIGVRIFDVIETSRLRVKNLETYMTAITAPSSVGMRYQVARRPRAIIMLNTIFMYGPWLVKRMYENVILNSKIAATGKTSNNLKDCFKQCYNTSRNLSTSSDDVVGMDTSTHKSQTAFVLQPLLRYASENASSFDNFFFENKFSELTCTKPDNTTFTKVFHAIEIFLLLENYSSNQPRTARGGFFMLLLVIGCIAFESGTYKTSTQHTALLEAIYKYVGKKFSELYATLGFVLDASVSGDDQFSAPAMIASANMQAKIEVEVIDKIREILMKFGYASEALVEFGYGEFLKQAALLGVPMPYGVRLAQFSSERGDAGGLMDKINNMFAIIGELSSRSPFPAGTVLYKNVIATLFGIQTISLMSKKPNEIKVIENSLKNMKWHKHMEGRYMYVYPRRYWMYGIPIGTPLLRFSTLEHNSYNFLEFPSPGYSKKINMLISKPVDKQALFESQQNMTADELVASVRKMGQLNRRQWINVIRRFGKNFALTILKQGAYLPMPLDEALDMDKAIDLGFIDCYFIDYFNKGISNDLPRGKLYSDIKRAGNMYLDETKRYQSSMATAQLSDMGISIPENLRYTNRIGARLDSVLISKDEPSTRATHTDKLVVKYKSVKNSMIRRFRDHTQFGQYNVTTSELDQEPKLGYESYLYGFGPCLPPGSIQSQYLDLLGPPNLNTLQYETVTNAITDELLLPGSGESTMRILIDVFARGGIEAFQLALKSIGVSDKIREQIIRVLYTSGFETKAMPYAFSPRLSFYYNADYPGINGTGSSRRFIPTLNVSVNDRVEWAVYISHIYSNTHHLMKKVQIDCKYSD